MGSRQADSAALVDRARKAGWPVEETNRGQWKIRTPGNTMINVHMTYSDHRSIANIRAKLERAGLTEAEAAVANARVNETRSRNQLAVQQADAKAQKIAAAAALKKAAGPYITDAEDVEIGWFTKAHPAMWMRVVNVTPEIAQTLLDEHNEDNRPLKQPQVDHYRNIILSGQWHLTHQGIAMDTRAMLQDGQHRLTSVVEAGEIQDGLVVPFLFCVGMPPENFKAIDEGLLRTASQLYARGTSGEKNTTVLQGMIKLVNAYGESNPRRMFRLRITNEKMMDLFEKNPEQYRASAKASVSESRKAFTTPVAYAAAHYLIRKANGPDNAFVAAFFEGLSTGRKAGTRMVLDDDDPRQVFRETVQAAKMKKRRIPGIDLMAMIILSWNNAVTNYTPKYLRFAEDAAIPRVTVCMDSGPKASACPEVFRGELPTDDDL